LKEQEVILLSKLIKNELTKIFKKKSIYITLLVVLAFVILTNCIYKFFFTSNSYYADSDNYIEYTKEELAKLDPNKTSDIKMYIDLKTEVDVYDMMNQYEKGAWQRNIVSNKLSTYLSEKNTYLYGENKDENKAKEIENKINKMLEKLNKDDWRYFANTELEEAQNSLKELESRKKETVDKQELEEIKSSIESAKVDEEVAKYRIDKDIKYGNDYRNTALQEYQSASKAISQISNIEQLEYKEKIEYNENVETKEISKYIIENNQDIEKINDTRGILKDLFSEYGLFIIVMIIMIAGTIVSEEFNKGTIKLLLIKPYTRNKILLSKFITTLIMIAFSIVAVVAMELIVGGIIFGYDSLSIPVLEYNFNTQTLEQINIFAYLGIQILAQLPMLILLSTLAFAFSTIFTNSALSIIISLLGYMSTSIINVMVIQHKVAFMKFFVTMNWDLSEYLFGGLPSMQGMTLGFSVVMCILYFVVMIIPTFVLFNKKNIKNI